MEIRIHLSEIALSSRNVGEGERGTPLPKKIYVLKICR